jgi:cell division protein FtsB
LTKAVQEQQEEIAGYRARLEALKERARILEQELSN